VDVSHPTRYTLYVRRQVEVNTDPQRRCYNGCHAKSELVWTDWQELCNPRTEQDGHESMQVFQSINPGRQYKLVAPRGLPVDAGAGQG
jgi:hypothetical protein